MGIGRRDVEHVARLARLRLAEDEIDTITPQLDQIIQYVEKLGELNTDGVEPTSHVVAVATPLREDEARPGLGTGGALANAPDRKGDFFRVPKIID